MTARYLGLNATTGQPIADLDHIRQSIGTILSTPLGTRVMRRAFGSLVPDLIDKPLNGKTRMQVMAATVMAISTWEPRVDLSSIQLLQGDNGASLIVDIELASRDGPLANNRTRLRVPLKG
jgi:phage baseplate assembly protein W